MKTYSRVVCPDCEKFVGGEGVCPICGGKTYTVGWKLRIPPIGSKKWKIIKQALEDWPGPEAFVPTYFIVEKLR